MTERDRAWPEAWGVTKQRTPDACAAHRELASNHLLAVALPLVAPSPVPQALLAAPWYPLGLLATALVDSG